MFCFLVQYAFSSEIADGDCKQNFPWRNRDISCQMATKLAAKQRSHGEKT
jgi:hypothetical protein